MDGLIFTKNKGELLEKFSKSVKSFMKRKGLNSKKISSVLGVTESAVNGWKYGRSFPDVQNLFSLIELGFSLKEDFFDDFSPLRVINEINNREAEIFYCSKRIDECQNILEKETNEEIALIYKKIIAACKQCIESEEENKEYKKLNDVLNNLKKRKADEKTDPKSELEALKPLYRK